MTDTTVIDRPRSHATSGASVREAVSLPWVLTLAGALLGAMWLGYLLLHRADGLATPAYDLAFFQQVVWNASRGFGFVSSFSDGSFLGLHFSPLLAVPALIETIVPDSRVLSLLHAAALAAAGPAAFLFLRAALGASASATWLAAAIAAPLPIWSAVQEAGRADFHTEALALPFALLAGWAGLKGYTLPMVALASVALLAKEDQGFTVFVIAAAVAARGPGGLWNRRRRLAGARAVALGLMAFAVAWTALLLGVVMPLLRDGAGLETGWYYAWLTEGGGPLAQAPRIGEQLTNLTGWMGAAGLVLSTGALGLLRPAWLLFALLPILANLLSANPAQADIKLHYTLLPMVPIIVAAAIGGRRLLAYSLRRSRAARRGGGRGRPASRALALVVVVPALLVAWIGGGLPPTMRTERGQWDLPPARAQLVRVAAQVPTNAVLSVDDGLAAALTSRAELRLIPGAVPQGWVLVDHEALDPGYFSREKRDAFVSSLPASGRPLISTTGRFELWGPLDE